MLRIPGSEDVPCVRSWAPDSCTQWSHSHYHQWHLQVEDRDNTASMWAPRGRHLGRASVKSVFIEHCQMVLCKYLCKNVESCAMLFTIILSKVYHTHYTHSFLLFKLNSSVMERINSEIILVLSKENVAHTEASITNLIMFILTFKSSCIKKEGNLKCFKSYC